MALKTSDYLALAKPRLERIAPNDRFFIADLSHLLAIDHDKGL
jgi:hypothetical protein